ncbi:MAG: hydrogenase formation protein HypD, partial [Coriobacteriales bacterium]|nr:hydrogenase formation protein HypD [Coriobacteriales bacterium]
MSNILDEFKDPQKSKALIAEIQRLAASVMSKTDESINIMEVCGTHTVSLARYGIRNILPPQIKLLSGPGCPVCVTANKEIDTAIELAKLPDTIITTFGDMMRVPGTKSSLTQEKAQGADVRVCYSQIDALKIAKENPNKNVIFIAVGFETTTPLTAATLKRAKAE